MFELNGDVKKILSYMVWETEKIAQLLRKQGWEIQERCEIKQAVVLHWLLTLYEKHGSEWKKEANKILTGNARMSDNDSQYL
jgi:hypothetical protein